MQFKFISFTAKSILFAFVIAVSVNYGFSQTTPAQAAAEQRARAFIEAVSSNNPAAWRKFISENFSKESIERVPAQRRFENIARVYDLTRGLTALDVRRTKPNEVLLTVRTNLTGELLDLIAQVEESAPYKINRFGVGLAAPEIREKFPAAKLTEKQIVGELDALLKKLEKADFFSGTVLLAKGDKILFEKAFGEANKDFAVKNNLNTKYNLGSMNKMFTAVAIAQLVEAGKLSFDDPLGKFMPDFPDKEAAQKIKIKHLLTHTSGLGSYFNKTFFDSSRGRFRTIDDFLALVKDEKMQFEPGTKWQYSNTGFLVLGKIIEILSGQNYFDYIRENIYRKAGMTDSDSYDLDRVNPNLAVGYEKEFTDNGVVFNNNLFQNVVRGGPAGGGYSTVGDLLRFSNSLRSGKLVGQDYVKILTTPKPEIGSPDYGYGFGISPGNKMVGHNGGFYGINADLTMFLDSNYTAVVLSNYGDASEPVVSKIREMIASCTDCK